MRARKNRWLPWMRAACTAAIALATAGCLQAPQPRESGAEKLDVVQLARQKFRDAAQTSMPLTQPVQEARGQEVGPPAPGAMSGPIRKESIGREERLRIGRGFEEDGASGSRGKFIDMYNNLLQGKHQLEIRVQLLSKHLADLKSELSEHEQKEASTSAALAQAQASRKLLEEALAAEQKRSEELHAKYIAAEEQRLENEIQLVRLQHELVKNGIALPSNLASVKNGSR